MDIFNPFSLAQFMDTTLHPCFNESAKHKYARIHLPVAPKCNVQCNFCDRRYDCVNESRPGVTSAVLSPEQALKYFQQAIERLPSIRVAGIAGPGDPFANGLETMETMRKIRAHYPEVLLCVASNGLEISPYISELAALQVSHVSITVNAVNAEIGSQIYSWVRTGRKIYREKEGAALIWERQQEAIRELKMNGIIVKANTVVIQGVNDAHLPEIASALAALKVDTLNPIPLCYAPNTGFSSANVPNAQVMAQVRANIKNILPLMNHCARCRADAVGLLGKDDVSIQNLLKANSQPSCTKERPRIAVASREGMLVNEHLGQARQIMVFEQKPQGGVAMIEKRLAPEPGAGDLRWAQLAEKLSDCFMFLVGEAGPNPVRVLSEKGLPVVAVQGLIEPIISAAFSGQDLSVYRKNSFTCGVGCGGEKNGVGCA
jgi:nitrogen fixation protein NifB